MASNEDRAAAVKQVNALKQQESEVTKYVCTVELRHKAGILLVWGGKKAAKAGVSCVLRLAFPVGTAIPMPERLARLGGLNITLPSDKLRWACNWTSDFLVRDWKLPLSRVEESQLALARYIMIGLQEDETRKQRRRLKKLAEGVDYDAEFKKYKRQLEMNRPKKGRTKVERESAIQSKKKKKGKKKLKRSKRK